MVALSSTMFASSMASLRTAPLICSRIRSAAAMVLTGLDWPRQTSNTHSPLRDPAYACVSASNFTEYGIFGNFAIRPTCAYFFGLFFCLTEKAGMRRCLWDTPCPRTSKRLGECQPRNSPLNARRRRAAASWSCPKTCLGWKVTSEVPQRL
jgi:hypothetical protein